MSGRKSSEWKRMWKPRYSVGAGITFQWWKNLDQGSSNYPFWRGSNHANLWQFCGISLLFFPKIYWGLVWVGKIRTACGTNGTTASEAERAHEAFERLRLEAEDNISAGVRRSRTGNPWWHGGWSTNLMPIPRTEPDHGLMENYL